MKTDPIKQIIENMEAMSKSVLSENTESIMTPLGILGRPDQVEPDMDLPIEGETYNGKSVSESVSTGAIDRMLEVMLMSPRAQSLMMRYGMDEGGIERLKIQLIPVLKMFFSSEGIGVSGASSAKSAVRAMGR